MKPRACVIQIQAGSNVAANIALVGAAIDAAVADCRPDLVSLPEMWSCLGGSSAVKHAAAEELPVPGQPKAGPLYEFLSSIAARHRITLHGGSIGERGDGILYNTSLVFGPNGEELGRYRKIHLFDIVTPGGTGYRESKVFGAGQEIVVCDTPVGRLGLTVCYDLRFAHLFWELRARGADMIMVPAAFTAETGRAHWEVLLRARAIETQTPLVAAATVGEHFDGAGESRHTWGHAMIVDGWGKVLTSLEDAPGFAAAELDSAQTAGWREKMPVMSHRRLV